MQQRAAGAGEVLDRHERRLRRIYPLVLMSTVYKQFWITLVTLFVAAYLAIAAIAEIWGLSGVAARGGPGAMLLSVVLPMSFLALVAAGVFLLDFATRRFTIIGGICWLLLGLAAIAPFTWSMKYLSPAASAVEKTLELLPAHGALLLVSVIIGAIIPLHYVWVIFRGAFALLWTSRAERRMMREASAGTSFASRFLIGLWGLPSTFEFVRRPRLRFAAVFALAILTGLCFSIAIVIAISTLIPIAEESDFTWLKWVSLIDGVCVRGSLTPHCSWFTNVVLLIGGGAAAVVVVLIALGGGARMLMRRLVSVSLEHVQRVDGRAPILFLRAFGDDQVPLKPPRLPFVARLLESGRRRTNLDRVLVDEATAYGPVVGLGNPKDKRPPYGAARGYFDDKTWQEAVADLARNSLCIIICIDDTDGIWWEVEHLTDGRHLAKTLFLIHPKHNGAAENGRLVGRLAEALRLPAEAMDRLRAPPPGSANGKLATVLAFYFEESGTFRALRSSTFSRFAFGLALRQFLRGKLGLAVRPLPRPGETRPSSLVAAASAVAVPAAMPATPLVAAERVNRAERSPATIAATGPSQSVQPYELATSPANLGADPETTHSAAASRRSSAQSIPQKKSARGSAWAAIAIVCLLVLGIAIIDAQNNKRVDPPPQQAQTPAQTATSPPPEPRPSGTTSEPQQPPGPTPAEAMAECDRLAAHPFDPQKPASVPGVRMDALKNHAALAVEACQKAAEAAPQEARMHFQLGRALHMKQDFAGALRHYTTATEVAKYAAAYGNAAHMLLMGQGVEKNLVLARGLAAYAGRAGFPDAQFDMGNLLMEGLGGDMNYQGAYCWFYQARHAYPDAANFKMKILIARMSQSEIESAIGRSDCGD